MLWVYRSALRDNLSMRRWVVLLSCMAGMAAAQPAQPAEKLYIHCSEADLLHAVPDLAGTTFATSQDDLDALLNATSDKLRTMFAGVATVSAAEQIHQVRIEDNIG